MQRLRTVLGFIASASLALTPAIALAQAKLREFDVILFSRFVRRKSRKIVPRALRAERFFAFVELT